MYQLDRMNNLHTETDVCVEIKCMRNYMLDMYDESGGV